jgi:hypothetical protein
MLSTLCHAGVDISGRHIFLFVRVQPTWTAIVTVVTAFLRVAQDCDSVTDIACSATCVLSTALARHTPATLLKAKCNFACSASGKSAKCQMQMGLSCISRVLELKINMNEVTCHAARYAGHSETCAHITLQRWALCHSFTARTGCTEFGK